MSDFVGIQIAPISFVDEGVEKVLDTLQEKGAVNALAIMALSWSESASGRTRLDFVDHGINGNKQPDNFFGGAFWEPDPKYYGSSFLKQTKTADPLYKNFDTLLDVIPAARKRGMKVYIYYWETQEWDKPVNVTNFGQVVEVDAYGRRTGTPCFNHPAYRSWLFSLAEEWCQRHDVDGLNWGIERQGPLTKSLVYDTVPACFCPHCRETAARRGIDAQRARQGYLQAYDYLARVRAGAQPRDGFFVTFLRILLNYPEVFQWEKLWLDSQKGLYREIYGLVKFLNPQKEVGLGILQWINSFNPYLRAQHDYEELVGVCDWVKPVLYNAPAGGRFKGLVETLHGTILKDASVEESANTLYRLLHLDEAPLNQAAVTGFSPGYVQRETARLVGALGGAAKVYPGIGAGVPVPGGRQIQPAEVQAAIRAAYAGGAGGILLSRSYADTTLANLEAAGSVLRELGKV